MRKRACADRALSLPNARNLLYTGVTRGKRLVVLIGQPKACALAVRNVRAMRRLTNLAARLRLGRQAMGTRG